MNTLFVSPEVAPFAKTGGLADVAGSLPKALAETGCSVRVALPFYKCVKDMNLNLTPLKVDSFDFLRLTRDRVEYIFVVNDAYYDRNNLYSDARGDYPDNDRRFSYFCKAVISLAGASDPSLEIIHCNDWQTGLIPLYLRLLPSGQDVKTLFTIHNIGYQGLFKRDALAHLDIPRKFYHIDGIEYYGKISFLKAGIVYSSAISTVSKGYAREILTPELGCGMDGILKTRKEDIYGILNGVDYSEWSPAVDRYIVCNYDAETIERKDTCKKELIEAANLPPDTFKRPLIGVISRLAEQKGIDLIVEAAKEIIGLGASIVILGTGDEKYNALCAHIAKEHPDYISTIIKFDNVLAHKIEAGSDMFVMPSRYEPCGLNQLYSLRYGTFPVVRATGGLDDTIVDISEDSENGNGIKFTNATKKDLVNAVSRAIDFYNDRDAWRRMLARVMQLDFSWKASASHYKELYAKIKAGH